MELLTMEEAANLLKVPVWQLRRWCQERRIAFVQASPRRRLFTREQLEKFIEAATVEARNPRIDKRPSEILPFPRKGGEKRLESSGEKGKGLSTIRKELTELCQS
jgi:excisionase family DNA binding protein